MRRSKSSVAVRPTGSTPQISPTSRPTLAGLLTPTPTNSKLGWARISGITILPTKPVPQTTTRLTMDAVLAGVDVGGGLLEGGDEHRRAGHGDHAPDHDSEA